VSLQSFLWLNNIALYVEGSYNEFRTETLRLNTRQHHLKLARFRKTKIARFLSHVDDTI
jgi:hypothetical protein